MGRYNTILQKGRFGRYEECRVATGVSIYPGMTFEFNSSGEAIIATPNAGGAAPSRIALEEWTLGRTVDTPYTAGELMKYLIAQPGEFFAILLKDAENVAIEDNLIAGDNGLFIKTTGTPSKVYARAREALDLSAAGANKLILAEFWS